MRAASLFEDVERKYDFQIWSVLYSAEWINTELGSY